ncbi:MAG: cytochrome P450 [Roseiflexaceae bacterium]|nr:cytochrome P450 [Roseiflexaceae bacterium]
MQVSQRPTSRQSPSTLAIIAGIQLRGSLGFFDHTWRTRGDLARIQIRSTTMLLATHPEHVRHVTVSRDTYDKAASYDSVRKLLLGHGLLTSTGTAWRRQRQLMAPFFTPRGIERYAPTIAEEGLAFCERWERAASTGTPVDVLTEMMLLTARITLKTIFSTESDDDVQRLKHGVEALIGFVSLRQMQPITIPMWLPTAANRTYHAARAQLDTYIDGLIAKRRALPEDQWPDDLLSKLMQARDAETGEAMSDALLRDEAVTLYFAGYETTARTLAFLWYALAAHPEAAEQVHREVDAVVGDAALTVGQLRQLPYTAQAIKETLRLFPSAPMFVRDAIKPDQIDGVDVPVGTRMMLIPYLTHRHPEFWPKPEQFDPGRWDSARQAGQHEYAYLPFAAGQRICIGSHLALMEGLLLAATLARRFAPQLMPGYQPQWSMSGTLTLRNGLPMVITRR